MPLNSAYWRRCSIISRRAYSEGDVILASPLIASKFGLKLVMAYYIAVKAADRFAKVISGVRLAVIEALELFELIVILGLCLFE